MDWFYLPVVVFGMLALFCGVFGWKWWMENPRARGLTSLLGERNARIFYMAFGFALILTGVIGLLF